MSDPRTRVLLFSNRLTAGGAERFASTLLCHLDRKKFAPELCLLRDEVDYSLPKDVSVTVTAIGKMWTIPKLILTIRKLIDDRQPDVVLSNIALMNLVVGEALLGCNHRPQWIARIGNNPAMQFKPWQRALLDVWFRRVYKRVDQFVANSQNLTTGFADYFETAQGRTVTITNPTDFDAIDQAAAQPCSVHATPGRSALIWVGRLHPQKRLDLLLSAFQKVREQHNVELWLCGDGPLRVEVAKMIEDRRLTESVLQLGFCTNPYPLMKQAKLILLSSDFEGLPNALIEAQGLGIPAVSTKCPFGPEEIVVHGSTGLLTAPGDADAFATAIGQLLQDEPRRVAMGHAAALRARQTFAAERIIRQWEQLLAKPSASTRTARKAA